jgi:hypothetical protein
MASPQRHETLRELAGCTAHPQRRALVLTSDSVFFAMRRNTSHLRFTVKV